jgi:hypothetical protein
VTLKDFSDECHKGVMVLNSKPVGTNQNEAKQASRKRLTRQT